MIIKLAAAAQYSASLVLLYGFTHVEGAARPWTTPLASGMFTLVTLGGCIHTIAGTTITVAVEREWVTCIAGDVSAHLTTLNTYMRRIDLFSKLAAPLFVSLLTSVTSYRFAAIFLCGVEGACLLFELLCMWYICFMDAILTLTRHLGITISYRGFPVLREAQEAKEAIQRSRAHHREPIPRRSFSPRALRQKTLERFHETARDWREFSQYPVFLSSVAISWLYLTVLSFDGTMLTFLKAHAYSDAFLAGMRGLTVITGLMGTLAMPFLEKRVGLVRAGNWSIWYARRGLHPFLNL